MSLLERVSEALSDFQTVAHLARLDDGGHTLTPLHLVPHVPRPLPPDAMQVYVFGLGEVVLKVGRTTQNARARYHHYGLNRSGSSLANALLLHGHEFGMQAQDYSRMGEWICTNVDRVDVDLPRRLGEEYLNLLEAFLIARLGPRFEGRASAQRSARLDPVPGC